jgi:hypothetical protein
LVARWHSLAGRPDLVAGACVDAPAGHAHRGAAQRDTERCAAGSFPTEDEEAFDRAIRRFSGNGNHTPLRQRYYWKLLGHLAFRFLAVKGRRLSPLPPLSVATALSSEALPAAVVEARSSEPARGSAIPLPSAPRGSIRIREGFPSDAYARANGKLGVLAPGPRALLAELAASPWEHAGNDRREPVERGRIRSSVPPPRRMSALRHQQDALRADLGRSDRLASMVKVHGDPAWADLWDAFACAFAACAEAHGCAVLVGSDPKLLREEGAILSLQAEEV